MNPLDVLDVVAKVRRVIRFILEEDTDGFVADEFGRLDAVVVGHEVVVLEAPGLDGQHEVSARFHARVASGFPPHFDGVARHAVFAAGFLVFAVGTLEKAVGPGVAVVPIEHPREGEVWI